MGPARPARVIERRYRGHSATLETTWELGESRLTLTETMIAEVSGRLLPSLLLVRRLSVVGAAAEATVRLRSPTGRGPPATQGQPAPRGHRVRVGITRDVADQRTGPRHRSRGAAAGGDPSRASAHRRAHSGVSGTADPRRPRGRVGPRARRRSALAGLERADRRGSSLPRGRRAQPAHAATARPTRRPARPSPPRRPRSRSTWAAFATGTTDTPGPGTPASASRRSSPSAKSPRPQASSAGCCTPADSSARASPSCSPSTGATFRPNAP